MKDDRRMKSIAKRMNRVWFFRMLLTLLLVDALLLGLSVFGFCYAAEEAAGGWRGESVYRHLEWDGGQSLRTRAETIRYSFETAAGERITVDGEGYFHIVSRFFTILCGFETVLLLLQYITGRKKARRLLSPLEKMARTAQELSRAQFDMEKLHHLESALATVSPTNENVQLKTGSKELQSLEAAINDLLRRMQEAYREQSRFTSDASHELRTPIAVIQGYADMLARWGKDDPKILAEGIEAIQSETAHMKKLVEQLLFLARGDNGRNQLTIENVDIAQMMREVYEESCMIQGERQWRLMADAPVMVQGDAAMLKQTARILTDNAVKYTEKGDRITLRARFKEGVPCFEVQDNGIGIREEDLNRIFDRFFRSDPARTRAGGGTGLGLSIAKWIVEKHGGYFDVFSREEFGTRISVVLPQPTGET